MRCPLSQVVTRATHYLGRMDEMQQEKNRKKDTDDHGEDVEVSVHTCSVAIFYGRNRSTAIYRRANASSILKKP